jgi:hypothetical protein
VIHDGTEEEIPARVQEAKEEICSTMTLEERNTLQVVRFYDKAFNWYESLSCPNPLSLTVFQGLRSFEVDTVAV